MNHSVFLTPGYIHTEIFAVINIKGGHTPPTNSYFPLETQISKSEVKT